MHGKKKIVFICGCLEQGKDGVGDYVRKLSLELLRDGHDIKALSINDKFISAVGKESFGKNDLSIFRIPMTMPEIERVSLAKEFIDNFKPDWLSLQFVIFSFDKRGLPFTFAKHFAELSKNVKLHIMFHELWVGMNTDASLRHKAWGFTQRHVIKSLVRKLKPLVISTQNTVYQTILNQEGIPSFHLPLFGNIENKSAVFSDIPLVKSRDTITILVFGTIHPDSLIDQFAKEASLYAKESFTKMHMILIGRSGAEQNEFSRIWTSYGFSIDLLGEQDEEVISRKLSSATFGISTTTFAMIEKSGTVAAMIEHHLPVLCIAKLWRRKRIDGIKAPQGIFQYNVGELKPFINGLANIKFRPQNAAEVALTFVNKLISE